MKTARIFNKEVPASLWKRLLAYILDVLIINLIVIIPFSPALKNLEKDIPNLLFNQNNKELIMISTIITILTLFYFIALEFKTRQTIGKMALGIHVSNIERKELTITQIIMRNLTKPFTLILIVDTVYMFFKKTNQRLFEVFSRTQVVENEVIIK